MMPAMTKRVNINAPVAVKTITPPIYGTCKNVIMTTGDILKCLCRRAIVEEILPDGSTVRLNMRNYYTDNGAGLFVEKEKKKHVNTEKAPEAPKSEEKKDEAPVVETSESNNEEDVVEPADKANDSTDTEPVVEPEVEEVAEVVTTPPKKNSKKGNKKSVNTVVDAPAVGHEDTKQNVTGDNSTESSNEDKSVTE